MASGVLVNALPPGDNALPPGDDESAHRGKEEKAARERNGNSGGNFDVCVGDKSSKKNGAQICEGGDRTDGTGDDVGDTDDDDNDDDDDDEDDHGDSGGHDDDDDDDAAGSGWGQDEEEAGRRNGYAGATVEPFAVKEGVDGLCVVQVCCCALQCVCVAAVVLR